MKGNRIIAIAILRALTMFFMLFVNDLWSLTDIPTWLLHTKAHEDGMGFSDVIFPLFLFIVGLSIPLALQTRKGKGESTVDMVKHILSRAIALLCMGFFMVNFESMPKNNWAYIWEIGMALGLSLIWLNHKRMPGNTDQRSRLFKGIGIFILLILALNYTNGADTGVAALKPHWWGILGLIGWSYLVVSLGYLLIQGSLWKACIVFLVFHGLNIWEHTDSAHFPAFKIVISASNYSLVMAGACATLFMQRLRNKWTPTQISTILGAIGMVGICYGFILRKFYILSKIGATPSWTQLCIGIGLVCLAILIYLTETSGAVNWANPIKAAGTATLTCYLIPYFVYPLVALTTLALPEVLSTGWLGLLKSLVFAFLVVKSVERLQNKGYSLKV
jgi:predicted acyltransferase